MSDNANFCPTCGAPAPKKERKETGAKKNYARGAHFHIRISEARDNGLHWKLAELAAVITCVIMGIWSYAKIGSPQIGALIIFFIVFSIIFQLLSRFIFFLMDVFSRRAYNFYFENEQADGYTRTEEGWYNSGSNRGPYGPENNQSSNHARRGESHKAGPESYNSSDEESSYESTTDSSGLTYEEAMKILGLEEPLDSEKLKKVKSKIKKHHPDEGGNAETFGKLWAAYKLLEPYGKE